MTGVGGFLTGQVNFVSANWLAWGGPIWYSTVNDNNDQGKAALEAESPQPENLVNNTLSDHKGKQDSTYILSPAL